MCVCVCGRKSVWAVMESRRKGGGGDEAGEEGVCVLCVCVCVCVFVCLWVCPCVCLGAVIAGGFLDPPEPHPPLLLCPPNPNPPNPAPAPAALGATAADTRRAGR